MEIYTIGFTKRKAESFFETLKQSRIRRLVDVRVNNTSQLAGFAKQRDLVYFLRELVEADYVHELRLAPTKELLKAYRTKELTWAEYERAFMELLTEREVEKKVTTDLFARRTVLLCSEPTPEYCHRRLVIDHLDRFWGNVKAVHL